MKLDRDEDLDVYQKAFQAVLTVHDWTRHFPMEERFALVVQMHRAASSVPANIAEGFVRLRPRDKARFYNIAEGSAEELSVLVRLAARLDYPGQPPNLLATVKDCAMMLRRLTHVTLERA